MPLPSMNVVWYDPNIYKNNLILLNPTLKWPGLNSTSKNNSRCKNQLVRALLRQVLFPQFEQNFDICCNK